MHVYKHIWIRELSMTGKVIQGKFHFLNQDYMFPENYNRQ